MTFVFAHFFLLSSSFFLWCSLVGTIGFEVSGNFVAVVVVAVAVVLFVVVGVIVVIVGVIAVGVVVTCIAGIVVALVGIVASSPVKVDCGFDS